MFKRLFVLCALFLGLTLPAQGQAPSTIGYQGILTDGSGAAVPNGAQTITFRLYSAASGGSVLWTETQTVTTTSGVFSATLGSVTALNVSFNQPLYLGISVGGGAELMPRIALTASPYSLTAKTVEDGAVSSGKLADNAVTTVKIQDGAVSSAKIAGGAVTTTQIADGTVATADLADNAVTGAKVASGQVVKSVNSLTDTVTLTAGSNVTITPSGNTLTIAATGGSGNTLDQAYDQGGAGAGRTITADAGAVNIAGAGGLTVNGSVGIGTTSPDGKLTVLNGSASTSVITVYGNNAANEHRLELGAQANYAVIRGWKITIGESSLVLNPSGSNIGIGTTSPGNILTVQQTSATDPIADAWTVYSSRRWKTNIQTLKDPMGKVKRLRGVSYRWKADGKKDHDLRVRMDRKVILKYLCLTHGDILCLNSCLRSYSLIEGSEREMFNKN